MRNNRKRSGRAVGLIPTLIGCLCFWGTSLSLKAQPMVPLDSVYQLQTGREIRLMALGLVANGAAFVIGRGQSGLTEAQIARLDPQTINAFDRGATRNWSPKAARLSDLTLLGTVGVVGLTGLPTLRQKKWFTVPLLYAQTMLLTLGAVDIVKEVSLRNRPFVYHTAAPLSEKMDVDARRAFFSGHAATSFASAVFASTVFGHYFPVSKLKPVVWVGSLGLATTTALLRYEAGKHFPTDLVVGAAVGSAVGWLVPRLHRPRARNKAYSACVTPWTNGLANGVYVQVALP